MTRGGDFDDLDDFFARPRASRTATLAPPAASRLAPSRAKGGKPSKAAKPTKGSRSTTAGRSAAPERAGRTASARRAT
ncbi:MAG: hypothetical protein KF703_20215, partial [Actinobacteria bacterium]|nr:hypothetical protein [Actinomycetota bacterium]